jgi:hypothetical protein
MLPSQLLVTSTPPRATNQNRRRLIGPMTDTTAKHGLRSRLDDAFRGDCARRAGTSFEEGRRAVGRMIGPRMLNRFFEEPRPAGRSLFPEDMVQLTAVQLST